MCIFSYIYSCKHIYTVHHSPIYKHKVPISANLKSPSAPCFFASNCNNSKLRAQVHTPLANDVLHRTEITHTHTYAEKGKNELTFTAVSRSSSDREVKEERCAQQDEKVSVRFLLFFWRKDMRNLCALSRFRLKHISVYIGTTTQYIPSSQILYFIPTETVCMKSDVWYILAVFLLRRSLATQN